jgi:hypothetical protein
LIATLGLASAALAQDQADLAKAAQNPVAAMISLPFQNNTFFGIGPDDDVANVLNIQPVIPINLGPVNLINRTIVPLIYLPDLTNGLAEVPAGIPGGSTFGLGDINYTGWISPVASGPVTFGIGPSISLPSATDDVLGSEKWSAGPSAVAVAQPGPFVVGGLIRQLWSFAGKRRPAGREPDADPAVRQLQPARRLVPGLGAGHHRQLGSQLRRPLAGAARRRRRPGVQDRPATRERRPPGLLQRREARVRPRLVAPFRRLPAVPEVSEFGDTRSRQPDGRRRVAGGPDLPLDVDLLAGFNAILSPARGRQHALGLR